MDDQRIESKGRLQVAALIDVRISPQNIDQVLQRELPSSPGCLYFLNRSAVERVVGTRACSDGGRNARVHVQAKVEMMLVHLGLRLAEALAGLGPGGADVCKRQVGSA